MQRNNIIRVTTRGQPRGVAPTGVLIINMTTDRYRHHRRSIRLRDYDYTQAGAYFVTIVCQDRACLFGNVIDGAMHLNDAGKMVQAVWDEIPLYYPGIDIDACSIMPNHMHGIIVLFEPDDVVQPHTGQEAGQPHGAAPTRLSLPDVVHRFKLLTTKRYSDGVKLMDWTPYNGRVWQRNYYEHIIRNEHSLQRIREYIDANPAKWDIDPENPVVINRNRR
jgi:putative transposase